MGVIATVLLLDVTLDGDEPVAELRQADRHKAGANSPDPEIRQYFRVKTAPKGYADLGAGGIYVEVSQDIQNREPITTGLTRSGGRFSLELDTSSYELGSRIDLVVVFPPEYIPEEMEPWPHEAKVMGNRLALRWRFRGRQPLTLLSWHQRPRREAEKLGNIEDAIGEEVEKRHGPDRKAIASQDASAVMQRRHVVILVHGINTYALWQNEISALLQKSGFTPRPIGYDHFSVVKFLSPFDGSRRDAVDRLTSYITDIRGQFPQAQISFIAHSFGTFVVAEFLRLHHDFKACRLILCGSVLPRAFFFADLASRFEDAADPAEEKIINDCGTHDIWPVLAERVTSRYGPSGTFGFTGSRVQNRWHSYLRHSDFLNEEFCTKYWIPFLKDGTSRPGARQLSAIPWYLTLISRLPIKLGIVTMTGLAVLCWFTSEPPSSYRIGSAANGIGFANDVLSEIKNGLQRSVSYSCPTDCLRGRQQVRLESVASENLAKVAVRGDFICERCYPAEALRKFIAKFPNCLTTRGLDAGRLSLDVNPEGVEVWADPDGRQWKLCKMRSPD